MPASFEDLVHYHFPSFIAKTLKTVDPAAHYYPNWHIELIAEYLEAARLRKINRLIINMPPRSLKSICVSVAWPAWLLGHDPTSQIIAASYASSLSIKHSLDCRQVMTSKWYRNIFRELRLAPDQNEKHKFMTTQRGFRFATSVGGSTTGEGGNYLIIDDPMNPAQAMNKSWRELVNQWFDHTFASRLNDKNKGVIILVMQRLHQQDLTAHLLAKGGWEHLSLPAEIMRPKVYQYGAVRKEVVAGELLHPARENERLLARAKSELGSSAFAAQYQQQPLCEEGGMISPAWLARYQAPPIVVERRVQSWDTAIKSGQHHDASVCLTFAECDGRSYLLDARVMRAEYPELKRAVYVLADHWRPDAILIEDKASGQQLLQDLNRESALPVIARQPRADKVTRFAAVTALIEAGKLVLPEQASWLADFESEVFAFPGGAHDDQVDALSQYLDWIRAGIYERLRVRRI